VIKNCTYREEEVVDQLPGESNNIEVRRSDTEVKVAV